RREGWLAERGAVTGDYRSLPIDTVSRDRLAAQGLRFELLDTADLEAFARWSQVDARGFHGGVLTDEKLEWGHEAYGGRRTTGVWDDGPDPVATVNAWPAPMTVPGGDAIL